MNGIPLKVFIEIKTLWGERESNSVQVYAFNFINLKKHFLFFTDVGANKLER
jgi:hypothetical protein